MLTPAFQLSQDSDFLVIYIKAPFAKVSETEVFIADYEFKFYSKPYYLRLTLPGEIVEDGRETAKYDTDSGSFTVRVPKVHPGEHFDGLDMLTKLLAPAGQTTAKAPLIEVIESTVDREESSESKDIEGEVDEEEFNWEIEQLPFTDDIALGDVKYGFGNLRSGVFKRLQAELHDVIDLKDADSVPSSERKKFRIADEDCHFDEDYYLADLYNDEGVQELLAFRPAWVEEYSRIRNGELPEDVVELSEQMNEKMLKLPRKEYLLDKSAQQEALIGLVDLIFAYCYNHRTTEGENNVESSWNIAKLSSTLSWLQTSHGIKECVVTCVRRSLCYPLYRNWKLAKRILKDTQRIFAIGRRRLLRCLLEIQCLLMDTESRYILNDLYVTDYCVWIQTVSSKMLKSLAKSLSEVSLEKSDVGFDLDELEEAAELAIREGERESASHTPRADLEPNGVSDVVSEMDRLSLSSNTADSVRPTDMCSPSLCDQHADKISGSLKRDQCRCTETSDDENSSSSDDSDSNSGSSSDSSSDDSDDQETSLSCKPLGGVLSNSSMPSAGQEGESKKVLIQVMDDIGNTNDQR